MRHRLPRVLAALFATWFAIVGMEPGALGACPMHSGAVQAHQQAALQHDASAHHRHAPAQSNPHANHHCLCLDGGCCAVALRAPSASVALGHLETAPVAAQFTPVASLRDYRVEFALPWPTAPPRPFTA
ncbi:MAG: hypothetical protein JWO05_211 [Gemmatimonadetes bacterium]|nr:hypothetical protein [Gemmatimonadota bacterium]